MSQVEEPAKKITIHDRVEEFSLKCYEHGRARKILVRNLNLLVHKVVRISRKNHLKGAIHSSLPPGLMQPGAVSKRRVGDTKWNYAEVQYNDCAYHEDFPTLVGMIVGYEVTDREDGGSVYLIVAAPGDRNEYRFNLHHSNIAVVDGAAFEASEPDSQAELLRTPIWEFGLRPHVYNKLRRVKLETVGDVIQRTRHELLAIPNFGEKYLAELVAELEAHGLSHRP